MNYKTLIEELQKQKYKMDSVIKNAQERVQNAPKGQVRVAKHGNGYQYYLRSNPADTSGKYLPVSKRKLVAELIQKKYDQQVIRTAKEQAEVIERFSNGYDPDALKRCYDILSAARKEMVIPVELPDREYVNNWQSFEYTRKGFAEEAPEHYSSNGERVRSKSEVMIADALKQAGVPYRYECPLDLGNRIIHPDFTVLRVADREQLYWEHLGMMDDPDYCQNAVFRIREYESYGIYPGISLIITMETSRQPINLSVINNIIRAYCL